MKTKNCIKHLRDGNTLRLWDRKDKLFIQFQLNKTTSFICWQRFVSKDKIKWIEWNSCLSLKEVLNLRHEIAIKSQFECYHN